MTTTNIQVGTKMLYVAKHGAEFVEATVTKTTKHTFTISLDGTNQVRGPFEKNGWDGGHSEYKGGRWSHAKAYDDTNVVRDVLIKTAQRVAEENEKKKLEQQAATEKRNEERAQQLQEVMDACGCTSGMPVKQMRSMETMPDNSRVYTLVIPVKPEYVERKKGWELIIVRCKDVDDMDWDSPRDENGDRKMIRRVEAAYTYTNGESYSFSSISTSKYKNDQDAVWDAIRHRYHSW